MLSTTNSQPVFSPGTIVPSNPYLVNTGGAIAFTVSDPDGDLITVSYAGLPGFITYTTVSTNSYSLAISPTLVSQAGNYPITITITDGVTTSVS